MENEEILSGPTSEDSELDTGATSTSDVEEPETSTDEGGESEQEPTVDGETETTEEESDYLPDEQEKIFPVETLAKYAKRYGYTLEEIQADPRLQNALKDKINSDILIQKRQQEQEAAEQEEPTPEKTENQTPQSRDEYLKQVEEYVSKRTDPEMAKQFDTDFLAIYSDQNLTADQRATKSANLFSKFFINLANTYLPDMIPQMMDTRYPNFNGNYEKVMYSEAWDRVRNSNESYGELPEFGTKAFQQWAKATAAKIPGLDSMTFRDDQGKFLPAHQQAQKKYELLARIATGQQVDPGVVKKAVEKGKALAKEADRSRQVAKLGSGKSTGKFSPGKNDDFRSMIEEHNASQRSTPLK